MKIGYSLRYEGETVALIHRRRYGQALRDARWRAARAGRNVVIVLNFHGPYAVMRPDGSVSRPPPGYEG